MQILLFCASSLAGRRAGPALGHADSELIPGKLSRLERMSAILCGLLPG
jgi:hypothetical protein